MCFVKNTRGIIFMQEIDYFAIQQNAQFFRALVSGSKLCCVIKNNAYGHNISKTCSVLSTIADCFAVSNIEEAKECLPFNKDVLILLPLNEADTVWAIASRCILTVDSIFTLFIVEKCAKMLNMKARIHVKIDSGMNRLGLKYEQLCQFVISLDPSICVEGIYSHFYSNIELECDEQLEKFLRCAVYLQSQFDYPLVKHIANTWAAAQSPKYHLDMVRVGIGLYGYGLDSLAIAKNVWGRIIAIRNVKKGECVGYNKGFIAEKDSQIATVDIGYSQGVYRVLAGSKLLVGSKLFSIVGNICMSMCMLDVTDGSVHIGDKAFLLCKENILSNDNVIIYEMLCNLQ